MCQFHDYPLALSEGTVKISVDARAVQGEDQSRAVVGECMRSVAEMPATEADAVATAPRPYPLRAMTKEQSVALLLADVHRRWQHLAVSLRETFEDLVLRPGEDEVQKAYKAVVPEELRKTWPPRWASSDLYELAIPAAWDRVRRARMQYPAICLALGEKPLPYVMVQMVNCQRSMEPRTDAAAFHRRI